jgi:DNA (cytosine-5)-methyltransferase 1
VLIGAPPWCPIYRVQQLCEHEESIDDRDPTRDEDLRALQHSTPPRKSQSKKPPIRIADLFCGAGGMSLGALMAVRKAERRFVIALALENDPAIRAIYEHNLKRFLAAPDFSEPERGVEELFDGGLRAPLTPGETKLQERSGEIDVLMGGPPCQGNSDLNNHTRRSDPRNGLYEKMARAAEVLEPRVLLVENVRGVVHDQGRVVQRVQDALRDLEYGFVSTPIHFDRLGVPQTRRRHFLIGVKDATPETMDELGERLEKGKLKEPRPVGWAIDDLVGKSAEPGSGGFDAPPIPSEDNQKRLRFFERKQGETVLPDDERPTCHKDYEHSYRSVYGRLSRDEPAGTMTTGFGSMGQGRYVHPSELRTLTPHEAARIQTFPDWFDFAAATKKRGDWAKAIGNAVPPLGMQWVIQQVLGLSTG